MTEKQSRILDSNLTMLGRVVLVVLAAAIVFAIFWFFYSVASTTGGLENPGDVVAIAFVLPVFAFPLIFMFSVVLVWLFIAMPVYYILTGEFYPLIDSDLADFGGAFLNDFGKGLRLVFLYVFGDWEKDDKEDSDTTTMGRLTDPDYRAAYRELEEELNGYN